MSYIYKAKKSCQVLGTQSLEDVLVYLSFSMAFFLFRSVFLSCRSLMLVLATLAVLK